MRALSMLAALGLLPCATVTYSQDSSPAAVRIIPARININTATKEELSGLAGIDFEIAGKIIAGRPYKATRELVDRKILTDVAFAAIMKRIDVRPSLPIEVIPSPRPQRYMDKPSEKTRPLQAAYGFR